MQTLRYKHVSGPLALMLSLVVAVAAAMTWGTAATSAPAPAPSRAAAAAAPIAQSPAGEITSKIRGTTADGQRVTGSFTPLDFTKKNGKVRVRGLLSGVVHGDDGTKRTFGVVRTLNVRSINGTPVRAGGGAAGLAEAAACDVLNLRLGPLDLDLLGLQINLNRIVLDIVAQSGAGKLLGNLLCAVAGLLDGTGLGGLLGRLTNLLDRIIGRLGLGL